LLVKIALFAMVEPASLLCVNCALAPPPHRRTWGRCVRCAELNLPSTYYCGDECAQAHWPKHQQYHKVQKERAMQNREGGQPERTRSIAEAEARRAEATGDEFDKRCAAAMALSAESDHNAAAKAWRKIIKQRPDEPAAYHNLANVMVRSGRLVDAAPLFHKAMELFEEGTEDWAESAAEAFDMLKHPDCDEVPKPEWWNDEGLKALSARVVALAPDGHQPCAMRALVLAGDALWETPWNVGPRTAAEIKEAATWYRRAAIAMSIPVGKQHYEQIARACDAVADPLLAKEEVEAAAARAAAEAEAEKARAAAETEAVEALKVAEAKATAAADELLAEEEKEKEKVSTTASKAKPGKGRKGKGRR